MLVRQDCFVMRVCVREGNEKEQKKEKEKEKEKERKGRERGER